MAQDGQYSRLTVAQADLLREVVNGREAIVFDRPAQDACVVGIYNTSNGAVAIYDYDLLVNLEMGGGEATRQEAEEWIDYNTVRSLEYMKDPRGPIIAKQVPAGENPGIYGYGEVTIPINGDTYVVIASSVTIRSP